MSVGRGVVGDIFSYDDFGFGLIDRGADGETVTMYDKDGKIVAGCLLVAGAESCAAE